MYNLYDDIFLITRNDVDRVLEVHPGRSADSDEVNIWTGAEHLMVIGKVLGV